MPPDGRVADDIAGEAFRVREQGVEREQTTVGMAPEGLLAAHVGAGAHQRLDAGFDEGQEEVGAAPRTPAHHRLRDGPAILDDRRRVVVCARDDVIARGDVVADGHQHGWISAGKPFEVLVSQRIKRGIAVQHIECGIAARRGGCAGDSDLYPVMPFAVGGIQRVCFKPIVGRGTVRDRFSDQVLAAGRRAG